MGKDVPLKEIFDPEHKRYGEGGEFRALYESDPDVKRVVDTAIGIEGLKRQWGVHAAGVIMSSEPLIDVIPLLKRPADGAMITQFDYPTCEALGPDQDGLPGAAQPHGPRRRRQEHRGQPRRDRGPRGARPRRPGDLPACSSAATPSASSSSTAARCARCCARCGPTASRTSPRSARSTGPARWAWTPTTSTPAARPAASPSTPIHPELAEPLAEILDETYGLIVYQEQVMAIAQKVAGYSLGQADLLRKAMGKKKKEILDAEYVPFSDGHEGQRLLRRRDQGAVGHPAAVLRLRLQQGPLRGVRPGLLLDRLPQGQLPGRVHGRAADVGQGRQGQDGDLPQRVPPDEDPGAAARRQRVVGELHPGRRPTSASASPRSATSATTSSTAIVEAREEKGRYADFNDFMDKVPALVCNKRVIESLVKAGAFDEMKHKRRALVAIHETAVDQYVDIKRNEAIGQDSLFGGLDDDGSAAASASR